VSSNRLVMEGLNELREQLRNLPEDLAREAGVIVLAQAEMAKDQIQRAYPEKTGRLRGGITVTREALDRGGAAAIVRSRAPHAHLHEYGTQPRRTNKGANRGFMPKADEGERMIPIIVRRRRAMVEALIAMVRRAGLTVEGK
jgi:hypothetical protein